MLDLEKAKAREYKLLQQKAKIESDLARAQERLKEASRRDDTRRKIVLGGVLLAAVNNGTMPEEVVHALVTKYVASRDSKLFPDGWLAR